MFLVRARLQLCQNWHNGNATLAVGGCFWSVDSCSAAFPTGDSCLCYG